MGVISVPKCQECSFTGDVSDFEKEVLEDDESFAIITCPKCGHNQL